MDALSISICFLLLDALGLSDCYEGGVVGWGEDEKQSSRNKQEKISTKTWNVELVILVSVPVQLQLAVTCVNMK